jgi:hypothetical protein
LSEEIARLARSKIEIQNNQKVELNSKKTLIRRAQMVEVGCEKTSPIGVLGLAVDHRRFNNSVLWRAIFAGWLVAARFAGKSFGTSGGDKSGSDLFSW